MKNYLIPCASLVLCLCLGACKSYKTLLKEHTFIKVDDTLWVGEKEVTNDEFREWGRSYGLKRDDTTTLYRSMTIDEGLFCNLEPWLSNEAYTLYCNGNPKSYFFELYDAPILGITYNQALNYSEWVTSYYTYGMLKKRKALPKSFPLSKFKIEDYLAGQYTWRKPKGLYVWRLPSPAEWEYFAAAQTDLQAYPYGIDMALLEQKYKPYQIDSLLSLYQADVHLPLANDYYKNAQRNHWGLRNIIGAASEMTDVEGLAKGGSWCHPIDSAKIIQEHYYSKPQKWLGFRLVCTWMKTEDYIKQYLQKPN